MIDKKINDLIGKIVSFAYHVENMLDSSIIALKNKDKDLFDKIINEMEPQSNKMELELDLQSISIIAQYNPLASNLRTTVMILKINNDLERMADNCVSICHGGNKLISSPVLSENIEEIAETANIVSSMLKDGILSFINNNHNLSKKVCKRDLLVNQFRDKKLIYYIQEMKKAPEYIDSYLELIKICDRLERIADLSTNIAESSFFITKGKVLKHKKKK